MNQSATQHIPPTDKSTADEARFGAVDLSVCALSLLVFMRLYWSLYEYFGIPLVYVIAVGLCGLAAVYQVIRTKRLPRGWVIPTLLAGGYILTCLPGRANAVGPNFFNETLEELIKGVTCFVVVLLAAQQWMTIRRVLWSVIAASFIMASISVYQYASGTFDTLYWGFGWVVFDQHVIDSHHAHRIGGPFIHSNNYVQILVMILPLALDRVWRTQNRYALIAASWAVFALATSVTLTYSRAGFVVFVLVGFLMLIHAIRHRPGAFRILLSAALLTAALSMAPSLYFKRMASMLDIFPALKSQPEKDRTKKPTTDDRPVIVDSAIRNRVGENLAAIHMFRDHPLRGIGLGQFPLRYLDYSGEVGLDERKQNRDAHNLYLEVAAETGLPGLILFTAIPIWLCIRLWRSQRKIRRNGKDDTANLLYALLVALVAYLTYALFNHASFTHNYWLLIAIAFAAANAVRGESAPIKTGGSPSD